MTKKTINEAFGVGIAILGTILSVMAAEPGLRLVSGVAFVLLCLAAAAAIHGKRLIRSRRAQQELLTDEALKAVATEFRIHQADAHDIDWVAEEEAAVYSTEDAIPRETLQEWFAVNPRGFLIVSRADGRRIGHLNMLPLKPATLERLVRGNIKEREIRGECLYGPAEKRKITAVHIESITLNESNPYIRSRAILAVLGYAPKAMAQLADPSRLQHLYAISATHAGDCLLRRLGFHIACKKSERADEHDLYVADPAEVFRKAAEHLGKPPVAGGKRSRRKSDRAETPTASAPPAGARPVGR